MLMIHITDPDANMQNGDADYASWFIMFPTLDEWKDRYDVSAKVRAKFQELLNEYGVNDPSDCEAFEDLIDWCRDEFDLHKSGDIIDPAGMPEDDIFFSL